MPHISLKPVHLLRIAAVLTAVGICAATLFLVRSWREGTPPVELNSTVAMPSEDRNEVPSGVTEAAKQEPAPSAQSQVAAKADLEPATEQTSQEPTVRPPEAAVQPQEKAPALAADNTDSEEPVTTQATAQPGGRLTRAEADAALKPLLELSISDTDVANVKAVVKHVSQDDYSDAKPYLDKIKDPAARKLALWYYYRAGASDTNAEDIAAFRAANPLWPSRDTLADRAEDALFWRASDPKRVLAFFHDRRPTTAVGKAALGGALISLGRTQEGRPLLRQAWRESALTPAIEARFREKYGSELRSEDHKARIDYLLVQDSKSQLPAIERLLPLIDKSWEAPVKACMASVKRAKNAGALLSKLDGSVKDHPAVLLVRLQAARRADKDEEAWALLNKAPTSPEKLIDPARWWNEREAQIRTALNEGDPKVAYAVAKNHAGDLLPEDISDAEFLAGWIALRFVNQPKAARDHFMASAAAGGLPFRRARAGYWGGRAELALGNTRAATARFAEAAQHSHTFYGQLAQQMIGPKDARLVLRTYVRPSTHEITAFNRHDVMRALMIAKKADLDSLVPVFLFELARNIKSAADMILTAELAQRIARPNIAVRMAKIAMNRGFPMEHYAYPDSLPQYKALAENQNVETALVHALTRQESEFNTGTVSSAGALGLMQLLPSTAKEVAKAVAAKFDKKKLTEDPSYNVSIGTAFLHQLVRSYDGSYIMTLAAYNAGPGRVRQWVELFGDPRSKKVDPIDWIERIPITETREYVHKIMESLQVYRARLDRKQTPLRLAQDIYRGRPDQPHLMVSAAGN